MIRVVFNDEEVRLPADSPLGDLLAQLNLSGNFVIAVNDQFVPRSLYAATLLSDCDRIDSFSPIQGG